MKLTKEYREQQIYLRDSLQEFCINCFFWYPNPKDNKGECRCGFPILVSQNREAIWPVTQLSDGCGDYESISDQIIRTCCQSEDECDEDCENGESWNEQVVADVLKEEE